MCAWVIPVLAAGVLIAEGGANAADKVACVSAHEASQQLSLRIRLAAAREQLVICADPSCPRLVREDCARWLSELDAQSRAVAEQQPRASEPLSGTTLDTATQTETTGDEASSPAPHRPNAPPPVPPHAERPEKPNPLSSFEHSTSRSAPRPSEISDTSPAPRLVPTGALISGGLGVTAIAAGVYFGARGWSEARTLRDTCAPSCDEFRVSAARTKLYLADISLLAGLGFSAVTGWLIWDYRKTRVAESAAAPEGISLSADNHNLRVGYRGTF